MSLGKKFNLFDKLVKEYDSSNVQINKLAEDYHVNDGGLWLYFMSRSVNIRDEYKDLSDDGKKVIADKIIYLLLHKKKIDKISEKVGLPSDTIKNALEKEFGRSIEDILIEEEKPVRAYGTTIIERKRVLKIYDPKKHRWQEVVDAYNKKYEKERPLTKSRVIKIVNEDKQMNFVAELRKKKPDTSLEVFSMLVNHEGKKKGIPFLDEKKIKRLLGIYQSLNPYSSI